MSKFTEISPAIRDIRGSEPNASEEIVYGLEASGEIHRPLEEVFL